LIAKLCEEMAVSASLAGHKARRLFLERTFGSIPSQSCFAYSRSLQRLVFATRYITLQLWWWSVFGPVKAGE